MSESNESQARRVVLQSLESLARAGVTHLPKIPRVARAAVDSPAAARKDQPGASQIAPPPAPPSRTPTAPPLPPAPHATMPPSPALPRSAPAVNVATPNASTTQGAPLAARQQALDVIRQEVVACTRCDALASQRTQTVFGVGNPNARLCFFGEAPGADEDAQGEPFVGRAGQLLDKIIEACTLKRCDVYILNVLKCRPPNNRPPEPDEVSNCRHFFERQLDVIQPEFICCLGASAAQALLQTTLSIGKLRGQFHAYRSSRVICTYHPAYLLRNPSAKRQVWDDMKFLMREMGVNLE